MLVTFLQTYKEKRDEVQELQKEYVSNFSVPAELYYCNWVFL